jgi:chromosomal replication initiation ATPase DnaA
MFLVSATRTMANARPKIVEAPKPVNIIEVNRRRRAAAAREAQEAMHAYQAQLAEDRRRVREMMEAANRAAAKFRQEWFEQEQEAILQRPVRQAIANPTSLGRIARMIGKATGVSLAEIVGPRRDVRVALIRHAIMYWACRRTDISMVEMGRLLSRDHTSVLHGKKAYVAKRKAMGRTLREVR